jgi:hypothetical protein
MRRGDGMSEALRERIRRGPALSADDVAGYNFE